MKHSTLSYITASQTNYDEFQSFLATNPTYKRTRGMPRLDESFLHCQNRLKQRNATNARANQNLRAKERIDKAQSIQDIKEICEEFATEHKAQRRANTQLPDSTATLHQVAATLFSPNTKYGLDVQTALDNHFRPVKPLNKVKRPEWEAGLTPKWVADLRAYDTLRREGRAGKSQPRVRSLTASDTRHYNDVFALDMRSDWLITAKTYLPFMLGCVEVNGDYTK